MSDKARRAAILKKHREKQKKDPSSIHLLTLPLAMVEVFCIVLSTDDVIEPLPSDRNGRGFDVEAPNAKSAERQQQEMSGTATTHHGPQEEATQLQCLESRSPLLLAQSTNEKRD